MPKYERHLRSLRDLLCGMIILRILMFHEIGIMLKSPEDSHPTTMLDIPRSDPTYRDGQTIQSDDSRTMKFVSQNHSLPTLFYVTFSHLKDFSRFETLVFPALDTFLQNDTYIVVLSQIWETKYHTELCVFNQTYSTYCQRIRPIFVDCPEGYFGPSPCCKQEKGLLQISNLHPNADWVVFMDDDVYLRSWHLRNFLSQFDPSDDVMLITAGGKRFSYRILGQAEYSPYPLYHCSRNFNFSYPWGQPVIYSLYIYPKSFL
jgi:Fringe-like